MRKILFFIISLTTIISLNACGGGNDEIHNWIIPENISGVWVATFPYRDDSWSNYLKEYRFTLQELNGSVSGSFEEFYYDENYFKFPLEGSFDSNNGMLILSHDNRYFEHKVEIFRFTSEAMMYAVSEYNSSLPEYECIKIADM
jgi:hypothetical protein